MPAEQLVQIVRQVQRLPHPEAAPAQFRAKMHALAKSTLSVRKKLANRIRHLGVPQNSTCYRNPLPLPTAKLTTFFSHRCLVATTTRSKHIWARVLKWPISSMPFRAYPLGSLVMNPWALAAVAAAMTSSCVAPEVGQTSFKCFRSHTLHIFNQCVTCLVGHLLYFRKWSC